MIKGRFTYRKECVSCNSDLFSLVMDLGWQPLAGTFLKKSQIGKEKYYPLKIYRCVDCNLVQLRHIVPKEELFQSFLSNVSMKDHFIDLAEEIYTDLSPNFVVEIGSNDGTLLEELKPDTQVLGIEPVRKIANIALKNHIPTIPRYFNNKTALFIKKYYGQADVIVAANVMAHIDNIRSTLRGIQTLLTDDGTFIMEVALYDPAQYDNYYHEHLYYYTVDSLAYLLGQFGLNITQVKPIPTHGGSIRIYAKKVKSLDLEDIEYISDLEGKIIGYGASGRGNTLLNYWKIYLDYIIDENPYRYGHYTPGTHIPVYSPDKLGNPDYILILAWNYKDQIIKKCRAKGYKGKFIIPFPKLEII